jgi:hypothetical protein
MALQEATVVIQNEIVHLEKKMDHLEYPYFFGIPKLGAKTRICDEEYKDFGVNANTGTCDE